MAPRFADIYIYIYSKEIIIENDFIANNDFKGIA